MTDYVTCYVAGTSLTLLLGLNVPIQGFAGCPTDASAHTQASSVTSSFRAPSKAPEARDWESSWDCEDYN